MPQSNAISDTWLVTALLLEQMRGQEFDETILHGRQRLGCRPDRRSANR